MNRKTKGAMDERCSICSWSLATRNELVTDKHGLEQLEIGDLEDIQKSI